MKYVKLIGLEIEGGWFEPSHLIHHDVSVCSGSKDGAGVAWPHMVAPHPITGKPAVAPHVGEKASQAMTLEKGIAWLKREYPAVSNGSCGFHVHVSLQSLRMYRHLASKEFWTKFCEEAQKFGKALNLNDGHVYFSRLAGNNRFALRKFRPLEQMALTTKPQSGPGRDIRRTLLNYCWAMHGTLECRLFPMWEDFAQAEASVRWFVNLVEDYLSKKSVKVKTKRRRMVMSREATMRECAKKRSLTEREVIDQILQATMPGTLSSITSTYTQVLPTVYAPLAEHAVDPEEEEY